MVLTQPELVAGFNPRAREGRDGASPGHSLKHGCFNPRAREGRDNAGSAKGASSSSFNPRAREGRDEVIPE